MISLIYSRLKIFLKRKYKALCILNNEKGDGYADQKVTDQILVEEELIDQAESFFQEFDLILVDVIYLFLK